MLAWHNFSLANQNIKVFKLSCRTHYEESILKNFSTRPKLFHSYIRNQKTSRPRVGPLLVGGQLTDRPDEMAEALLRRSPAYIVQKSLWLPIRIRSLMVFYQVLGSLYRGWKGSCPKWIRRAVQVQIPFTRWSWEDVLHLWLSLCTCFSRSHSPQAVSPAHGRLLMCPRSIRKDCTLHPWITDQSA